jgi:hypothetical protein
MGMAGVWLVNSTRLGTSTLFDQRPAHRLVIQSSVDLTLHRLSQYLTRLLQHYHHLTGSFMSSLMSKHRAHFIWLLQIRNFIFRQLDIRSICNHDSTFRYATRRPTLHTNQLLYVLDTRRPNNWGSHSCQ